MSRKSLLYSLKQLLWFLILGIYLMIVYPVLL